MRYFTKGNQTLSAPDNFDYRDFPMLTTEDEVGWAWYLSQVKRNMELGNPEHEENPEQGFYHAKYYGKAYMAIDRITSEQGVGRHRGLGIERG